MNLVDAKDIEWKPDDLDEVKKEVEALKVKTSGAVVAEPEQKTDSSLFGRLKSVVRKAVDCCIE